MGRIEQHYKHISALYNVANIIQAFRCLTGHVTSACLELILAVLKPKQQVEDVMEEGEDKAEEDSEVEEGKEEDNGSDEGVKEETEDDMEEGKEEDSSEENSDSSGDEGVEIGGGMDPVFADAVRQALGAAAAVGSDEEVWSYLNHTPLFISPHRARSLQMMRQCWQWMRPWGKFSGPGLP